VVFYRHLEMAARELGAGKLIFGSDGPEVDSRVELYKIKLLKLPPTDARVLGGNVASFTAQRRNYLRLPLLGLAAGLARVQHTHEIGRF
jgi:predicted TIM-barrel fold metal-dependent hydrolase